VRLGDSDLLLVTEGRLNILGISDEIENHFGYSACHEFVGQSTLTFETPSKPSRPVCDDSNAIAAVFALPPGVRFKLAFVDSIDTAVAAAGDPIRAN